MESRAIYMSHVSPLVIVSGRDGCIPQTFGYVGWLLTMQTSPTRATRLADE